MRNYWVCHVRGPNFDALRKKGFLVLYPEIDDYVFLEATPNNLALLKRQTELGISFLKGRSRLVTVTQEEIDRMKKVTTDLVTVGSDIEVINGYAENLSGQVVEIEDENSLLCDLKGYNRTFRVSVNKLDVAVIKKDKE